MRERRIVVLRIKKVKLTKEKKIMMLYEKQVTSYSWDEYQFTCSEEAMPTFYKALSDLNEHVIEMCELPESYIDRITVKGVSYSYGGENETMGATISASMRLNNANCDLNINTPHKASEPYNEGGQEDENQLLSGDCVDCLNVLAAECEEYINGKRAQGNLFDVA